MSQRVAGLAGFAGPGRPRVYRAWIAVLAFAAVSLTFAAAAFAAVSTYYGTSGMASGQLAGTCCFYSRDYNRVYRTVGYGFNLTYTSDNVTYWPWVGPNAWDNPFVDQRNATSARAFCNNGSAHFVSTVTCQTTVP